MPYGNKLLSIDQLLAAWQNRNQMENNSSQTAMQQKLAEKQLEAQDLANKKAALEMDLITSPFNIQRERWAGSGNANTPGVDKAISDNQKMQKLSMLTGKNMPNIQFQMPILPFSLMPTLELQVRLPYIYRRN